MAPDYLIVGAGFTGATCARVLAEAGKRVLVVEQRQHIGGNAYDEYDQAGILIHRYGPHIFHTNSREVVEFLSRFTAWRPYRHLVLARTNGRLVPVPINSRTVAEFGGDVDAAVEALYGSYTRKQWGPWADQLDPSVLARVAVRADDDESYFTDRYQCMPADGYTRLFGRLLDHPAISVLLQTSYEDIEEVAGIFHNALRIIYTGPIDEFFGHVYGRLPYRSTRFEFERWPCAWYQPVGVVNEPGAEVPFTRITEFKHLTGQTHHQTALCYEYPCDGPEPYHPVPTAESAALYQRYAVDAVACPRVFFAGRLGTYQYLNMDQCVSQALHLCAELLEGTT